MTVHRTLYGSFKSNAKLLIVAVRKYYWIKTIPPFCRQNCFVRALGSAEFTNNRKSRIIHQPKHSKEFNGFVLKVNIESGEKPNRHLPNSSMFRRIQ